MRQSVVSHVELGFSLKDDLMSGVQSQNAQWDDSLKKAGDDLEYLLSIKKFVKSLGLAIEK